jgi:signal transduction histidine kinase
MSSISIPALRTVANSLHGALWLLAASAVFWALEAWLVFSVAPSLDTFPRLLVFSECVGLTVTVCVLLLHRFHWVSTAALVTRWVVIGIVAIPVGYIVGHALAFLILDEPIRFISHGDSRMVPIVFTLLGAGFGLHFFAARERVANEAAARSEAQRLATESELRLLRAQLEPHMLFNTLANLRSLLREDTQQAERMIDQLIIYLRGTLAATRTDTTTLRAEFAQLRAYLDIMSLRMGPRLRFRLELPADIEQVAVPPMLLQPLVENAIKHGIEPKVGSGSIEVIARRTDAGLDISVMDTGLGLPPEVEAGIVADAASGSYGLLHVRERLKAVYGEHATLTLHRQEPAGVCAQVRIPL